MRATGEPDRPRSCHRLRRLRRVKPRHAGPNAGSPETSCVSAGSRQQRPVCTGTNSIGAPRLDRQLGATVAHEEARAKADQIDSLLAYSTPGAVRERLAAMLSEVRCLVAWQALDLGNVDDSWRYYENAKTAALESGLPAYKAHASAGQAFVLIDIGETASAAELLATARKRAA